ncbi:hypothetical protein SynBIOSU31_02610 [Synechococcus sp. BIOS-U3-1]|nr:hypothetical protein SynBIOSU31_02610 [Synechococcus sp. BIOS-U3-1]
MWVVLGVLPPRLLQDHSPSGEPHYTALVQKPRSSGETLVSRIDAGNQTAKSPALGGAWLV